MSKIGGECPDLATAREAMGRRAELTLRGRDPS